MADYVKQDWESAPTLTTPITAVRLEHLETQYDLAKDFTVSRVPNGGTTGQALVKNSNTSGDTKWAAVTAAPGDLANAVGDYFVANPVQTVPNGGTTGQALVKTSNSNGAVGWGNVAGSPATYTAQGVAEIATDTEVQTGTDTARFVTPAGLSARTATDTRTGVVELATTSEASTGTDTTRAVTPAGLKTVADTKASLASPVFTGNPTAPTATAGDNDTTIATTAFVTGAVAAAGLSMVFYNATTDTWPSRPGSANPVFAISTTDATAAQPSWLAVGDMWIRHPDALETL